MFREKESNSWQEVYSRIDYIQGHARNDKRDFDLHAFKDVFDKYKYDTLQ